MGTLAAYLVISVFAVWVLATIGLQMPKVRPWLRGKAVSVLIPEYRFFAPIPVRGDYHILYQDTYRDGAQSPWTEVCLLQDRRLLDAVWHPDKRERKALFDAVIQLLDLRPKEPKAIALTVPYLVVLNRVARVRRTVPPQSTQFAIMQSYGWHSSKPPAVVMLSAQHRIQ